MSEKMIDEHNRIALIRWKLQVAQITEKDVSPNDLETIKKLEAEEGRQFEESWERERFRPFEQ